MTEQQKATTATAARDRAFGRYFARKGAARVLREAENPPSNRERIARWRNLFCTVPIEDTLPQAMRTRKPRSRTPD